MQSEQKKIFIPCKLCRFPLQSSAKGFYSHIMEHSLFYLLEEASHLHVPSTERQCPSLPLELADTFPSCSALLSPWELPKQSPGICLPPPLRSMPQPFPSPQNHVLQDNGTKICTYVGRRSGNEKYFMEMR